MTKIEWQRLLLPAWAFMAISVTSIIFLQSLKYRYLQNDVESNININAANQQAYKQQLQFINNFPKFGYENVFANSVFLAFLQYFGNSEQRQVTGYSLSTQYFEAIIEQDPLFIDSYIFLVNSISMYAGEPDESINLLSQGLESMHPNLPKRSYFIWRHKATDELLFLGDTQAAKESYQTAADWAEQSTDKNAPLVAALSRETVDFLATDPSSKPAQIGAWSDVLIRAIDNNIREKAIARIEELGGTIIASDNGSVTVRYKKDSNN
ncbi:hypothetical protein U2F10_30900 [Leptothoe sp. EHU-05/26/07-4]